MGPGFNWERGGEVHLSPSKKGGKVKRTSISCQSKGSTQSGYPNARKNPRQQKRSELPGRSSKSNAGMVRGKGPANARQPLQV